MYITIDLGGTTTRIAASKDLKSFIDINKFSTKDSLEEQKQELSKIASAMANGNVKDIKAICVGVPGIVDRKNKRFLNIVNFPKLSNRDFGELFTNEFENCNIIGENDAAIAGLGEAIYGAGKDFETVAYLTISTGVGGIRIHNKYLDVNQKFSEPGHHIINEDGRKDTKLNMTGTVDAYISGRAFEQIHGVRAQECEDEKIWQTYAKSLSTVLVNITMFWAPDAIVIGGGLANHFEKFYPHVQQHLENESPFFIPKILKSQNMDNSGLYGCLGLFKQLNIE